MPTKEQIEDFKKRKAYHDSIKSDWGKEQDFSSKRSNRELQSALHEIKFKTSRPKKKK